MNKNKIEGGPPYLQLGQTLAIFDPIKPILGPVANLVNQ